MCYSVELDFKLQEEKMQPLMKRLCPLDSQQCPALPYSNEVFTTTPKRKSKTESKKHARWKLWFLWGLPPGFGRSRWSGSINALLLYKMDKEIFRRCLQNWWQQNLVHLGFSVETAIWVSWSTAETKRTFQFLFNLFFFFLVAACLQKMIISLLHKTRWALENIFFFN